MARKTFEMSFHIGGKLNSSLARAFSGASDKLTALKNEARQTQRALDQLNSDFRKGKIYQDQYTASTRQLTTQLSSLNKQIQRVEVAQKGLKNVGTAVNQRFSTAKNVGSMLALGAATATTVAAFDSLRTAGDFQQQMTKVGVLAGATESELKKLNDTALELGASSSLSASQVAVAMGELGAKGMDANKIIGAMPGIIAASEASGEDLALTSEVVTSALNAFGLQAEKASHVADVMAMSANATAAGVSDLGYSFKYAAPVANTLGISLEELAAATGIMVDKGLAGEQAGTSLRMALVRLSDPPTEARKALDKLGISVVDKNNKFKSLTQITKEWNEATKNLTDTQKVQYASTIFGTEAATGMLNLFASGAEKLDDLTQSLVNSTGAAEKAAKAMKDNYAGALEELQGTIESAKIKFATPILPVFQGLFQGLSDLINNNMDGIEGAGQKLAGVLEDIFLPFSSKPKFDPNVENPVTTYYEKLRKYNQLKDMDFGDKVVYALDQATAKAEEWLDGPGGESMNKIFTKLGEIAAKAWWNAFTGAVKSSLSNFGEGNIFSGLAMGAAANALTGGLLLKGGVGAGKWLLNTGKNVITNKNNKGSNIDTMNLFQSSNKSASSTPKPSNVVKFPSASNTTSSSKNFLTGAKGLLGKTSGILGKTAGVLGKAALPVAVVGTVVDVATSSDKTKAAVSGAGGLLGGAGGAKLGAAIGTAIAPGIGTAIGTALGGLAGWAAGKWLGGKATDTARSVAASQQSATFNTSQANTSVNSEETLKQSINKAKASTDKVTSELDKLAVDISQASGWLESLQKIQTAASRVEQELNNLASRIANIQLPNVSADKRVSYFG